MIAAIYGDARDVPDRRIKKAAGFIPRLLFFLNSQVQFDSWLKHSKNHRCQEAECQDSCKHFPTGTKSHRLPPKLEP